MRNSLDTHLCTPQINLGLRPNVPHLLVLLAMVCPAAALHHYVQCLWSEPSGYVQVSPPQEHVTGTAWYLNCISDDFTSHGFPQVDRLSACLLRTSRTNSKLLMLPLGLLPTHLQKRKHVSILQVRTPLSDIYIKLNPFSMVSTCKAAGVQVIAVSWYR